MIYSRMRDLCLTAFDVFEIIEGFMQALTKLHTQKLIKELFWYFHCIVYIRVKLS